VVMVIVFISFENWVQLLFYYIWQWGCLFVRGRYVRGALCPSTSEASNSERFDHSTRAAYKLATFVSDPVKFADCSETTWLVSLAFCVQLTLS